MRRTVKRSILPGWMMTMPGALITGFFFAFLLSQATKLLWAAEDMMLATDRAPQCYDVPQKLIVGNNVPDSYRARQLQQIRLGLDKKYANFAELGSLCKSGQCSPAQSRHLHKVFRAYVQSRALHFKYAEDYLGASGHSYFRRMYETRDEEILRERAVELHREGDLDLRKLDGYESAARMFLFKPDDEFVHCG